MPVRVDRIGGYAEEGEGMGKGRFVVQVMLQGKPGQVKILHEVMQFHHGSDAPLQTKMTLSEKQKAS